MDALEAILGRVSPSALGEPGPDDASLQIILSAAMRAPDHGRMKPWRFLIVRGAGREQLGDAFGDALKQRKPAATNAEIQAERAKALRAPLIVVVSAIVRDHPKVPAVEQIIAAGAATQNMLIAAHALGYATMWRTGVTVYDSKFKRMIGLSPEDVVVGVLYLGTAATMPIPRKEADLSMYVREFGRTLEASDRADEQGAGAKS